MHSYLPSNNEIKCDNDCSRCVIRICTFSVQHLQSYFHKNAEYQVHAMKIISTPAVYTPDCINSQTSNIIRTVQGNTILDHSDVAGASLVGAALTTSSLSTSQLASVDWARRQRNI